ncbi:hypothetical protein F4802DRAFT_612592 [Xylaria palmicola]|nr:hypothetical protein F4802DRAFT_612592 [Xylaria palmicola]
MTFPESVKNALSGSNGAEKKQEMNLPDPIATSGFTTGTPTTPSTPISVINGMPYSHEQLLKMGEALARARREKRFPSTITPSYNIQATIDDYEDLERLNIAREGVPDARDDAFHPEVSRLYIQIQRKIQDRDLTHGEVAAESNVRARLNGFANSTSAEAGIYNLMRHAVQSVLRLNQLTPENEDNLVNSAANRVVNEIRATVQSQAARGAHGVDNVNMSNVMDSVFKSIEDALCQGVGAQATRLDGQFNRVDGQISSMSSIAQAHNLQVNAIASHVNAIDNHVHAMGNNVNAMSSLVNSTNGNVTTLSTNVGTLQTIINMLPQMVTKAVQDMLPEVIGTAVEQAFQDAISNELVMRLQVFTNAVQEARVPAEAVQKPRRSRRGWISKLGFFKKWVGRRSCCAAGPTY